MLDVAIKYTEQIKDKFRAIWFDDRYKYWNYSNYFEKNTSITFSMDLGRALRDIFEKYNFRKLCFSVIIGNPIEKSYDKMCQKYGGRIIFFANSY